MAEKSKMLYGAHKIYKMKPTDVHIFTQPVFLIMSEKDEVVKLTFISISKLLFVGKKRQIAEIILNVRAKLITTNTPKEENGMCSEFR